MRNTTLSLIVSGAMAVSAASACSPGIEQMLKRDPFVEAKVGGQNSLLLKQIHDDPYQKKTIQEALLIGIPPENIYNAIGWGLTQLQARNEKLHDQLSKTGKQELPDRSVTPEFTDVLWKMMHYEHVIGQFRQEYSQGNTTRNPTKALNYWLEKIAQ